MLNAYEEELVHVAVEMLSRWDRPVPRYTSYPTAPQFQPLDEALYRETLRAFDTTSKPLSVYVHIPFCKRMCLFCACSVVLNRDPLKQHAYLDALLKEIEQLPLRAKRAVPQLHLGGGTPTSLTLEELELLTRALHDKFEIAPEAEVSIEIDPRTIFADRGEKLRALKTLGFNRVSFGVQDLDPLVQETVRRRQSEEMTVTTYYLARELGFEGINLDLIYGLPYQTPERFSKTIEKIVELQPDRIALFSYAKVPWMKAHQKAIPEHTLPSTEEKFTIYAQTRQTLMTSGYVAIGMDHFALPTDPLAQAYAKKTLTRNFQGYALNLAEDMLGLGVTSIGFLENAFFQNSVAIDAYTRAIKQGQLPVQRGYVLNEDDRIRRWVIQTLMCQFELDKGEFKRTFQLEFDDYFRAERGVIENLKGEGLVRESPQLLSPTQTGRLFIRLVAAAFDAYLTRGSYSRAV